MENHPVYQYYKDYIEINGKRFLWDSISVSSGKRFAVDNINGLEIPVIQYLGAKETTFSITIKYGGIYKAPTKTQEYGDTTSSTQLSSNTNLNTEIGLVKRTSVSGLKDSFLEQKNFLQNIINSGKSVKIVFPDGDIMWGIIQDRTKDYKLLGLNMEQLQFIALPKTVIYSKSVNSKEQLKIVTESIFSTFTSYLKNDDLKPFNFNFKLADALRNNKFFKLIKKCLNYAKSFVQACKNCVNDITDAINTMVGVFDDVSKIISDVGSFANDLVNLLKAPGNFVIAFRNIVESVKSCANSYKSAFKALKSFYKNIMGDSSKKGNSKKETSGQNNNKKDKFYNVNEISTELAKRQTTQLFALSFFTGCLELTMDMDYETDTEIMETIVDISEMYDSLINDPNVSDEIKELVFKAFNISRTYLLNQAVADKNIKTLNVKTPRTLENIIYEYYGNLEYYDDILSLNKDNLSDVLSVSGTIKIFE